MYNVSRCKIIRVSEIQRAACSLGKQLHIAGPQSGTFRAAWISPSELPPLQGRVPGRGLKSKATLRLEDLPQGAITSVAPPVEEDDDHPKYPTVVQQAKNNMRKFDNCILLTRVGGFYEACSAMGSQETLPLTIYSAVLRTRGNIWPLTQLEGSPEEDVRWTRVDGELVHICHNQCAVSHLFSGRLSLLST